MLSAAWPVAADWLQIGIQDWSHCGVIYITEESIEEKLWLYVWKSYIRSYYMYIVFFQKLLLSLIILDI